MPCSCPHLPRSGQPWQLFLLLQTSKLSSICSNLWPYHSEDRGVCLMLSFDIDIDVAIFCKRGLGDTGVNSTTGPLAQQAPLQGVNILGFVLMILIIDLPNVCNFFWTKKQVFWSVSGRRAPLSNIKLWFTFYVLSWTWKVRSEEDPPLLLPLPPIPGNWTQPAHLWSHHQSLRNCDFSAAKLKA